MLSNWSKKQKKYNVITYGINNKNSTYVATEIESFEDKSIYKLNDETITVPVGGEHFVLNSLCAIAVGKYYGMKFEDIKQGIEDFKLTKSRMEINKAKNGAVIINDCYNANYDSMKSAIKYLQSINDKRKIAVLGDMLELGEFSKKLHQDVGKEINNIDILITVGNEAKHIAENANAKETLEFKNNQDAIDKLKSIISPNDVVLLKASNSMNFEEIVKAIIS